MSDIKEMLEFVKFPSIKRLSRGCVISEKLDGTNAQLNFSRDGELLCGSRNKVITPSDDNYGFAKWANFYQRRLFEVLGEGRHYGEWWGVGIQRGYDLGEKRFSLFNSYRWRDIENEVIPQLSVVKVIKDGVFSSELVNEAMDILRNSSLSAPGFKHPEGIVIYHTQIKQMFKVTFEYDEKGKP